MPAVKAIFNVDLCFANQIISCHHVPIVDLDSKHVVKGKGRFEFKYPKKEEKTNVRMRQSSSTMENHKRIMAKLAKLKRKKGIGK